MSEKELELKNLYAQYDLDHTGESTQNCYTEETFGCDAIAYYPNRKIITGVAIRRLQELIPGGFVSLNNGRICYVAYPYKDYMDYATDLEKTDEFQDHEPIGKP